jgi:DNA polymerase III epsilon subunit family exonuclease
MKYVFIAIAGVLVFFFVGNDSWKTLLFLLLALLAFIFLVSPSDADQASKKQLEKQLGPLGAKASDSPVACKACQVEIHGKAEHCYNCGAVVNSSPLLPNSVKYEEPKARAIVKRKSSKATRYTTSANPVYSMLPAEFVVLDFETTGLHAAYENVIEIGAIKMMLDSPRDSMEFSSLVKPDKKISKRITQITGITQDMLEAEGADRALKFKELYDFIGDLPVIAYNAPFDARFLDKELGEIGLVRNNEMICAMQMAKRAWPDLESYKLGNVANYLGINSDGAHRAIADVVMTVQIYMKAAIKLKSYK